MRKILLFLFLLSLSVTSLLAQDKLSILFVHDSNYNPDRADVLKAAIINAGYTYSDFDAVAAGTTPNEDLLSEFELVIWYTGDDQTAYLWEGDDTGNDALKAYLDNGGMLWLQSKNFLYKKYTVGDVFTAGDFVYDYLGVSKYAIRTPSSSDVTIGIPQFDLVTNSLGITTDPLTWAWSTMYGIDAFETTDTADSIYITGPSTHQHAGYSTSVYNEGTGGFKALTTSAETGKLETVAMTDQFVLETLDYFNQFGNPNKVSVTSFAIDAPYTIVSPYGTLQLSTKDVLPVDADNKSVTWSIVSGEASGSVDGNGLFTPTDVNGTVVIAATTNDGSAIVEQITITVEDKLSILFVHDSNYYPSRADVLKAAITNAGYHYAVFDAVAEDTIPSLELLSAHELVIWYTGDDQTAYLWEGNNTGNDALKAYLDNGGMLWLQSKNFLYKNYTVGDVFTAGDFVYDYLGVSKYAIRTPSSGDVTIGIPQFDLVTNSLGITTDPLTWAWGTMYGIDAFETTATADSIYITGPSTHQHAGYSTSVYNEGTGGFKALTTSAETGKLETVAMTDQFVLETLDYFNQFANTSKTAVTGITVSAANDAIVLDLSKTLQFTADVLPIDASNSTVSWSINEDAAASINQNGLLTATNTPEVVTVTATANDGSGILDTYEVEIKSLITDKLSILLIQDNSSDVTRVDTIKSAITTAGYGYTLFDAVTNAQAPSAEFLAGFELVIWYTGNDEEGTYLWNGDDTDNAALKTYLDNGGMLWLQGSTFLYDRYGVAPQNFTTGDFAYDYLGAQKFAVSSYIDEGFSGGVTQLDIVANTITTIDPLNWVGDKAEQYVAGCELIAGTQDLYQMGPAGYSLAGNSTAFYNEVTDGFKALTFTFDPSQLKTNLNPLYQEVLDYFNGFANTSKTHVYEVTVSSENDEVAITEEGGSLQLVATVLPESAQNKTVTWSLGEGSVPATISTDGLLTSSGTIEGNGSVFAIATSNDKPEFADTLEISIIGQAMSGFTVLLVNDADSRPERYLYLDEALTESGYTHIVYDVVKTGVAPNIDYMSHFDMVFWYAANDGVDNNFWDVSDTTGNGANAVKANPTIIEYLNGDGIVLATGTDLMYDIFGSTTTDFVAGDFIYDYLGITQYVQAVKDVASVEITAENEVTTTASFGFAWTTIYYPDGFGITDNATPLYKFPSNVDAAYAGLPTIVMNKPATGGTIIFNGSELAMLGDGTGGVQSTVNDVTKEFIDYFAEQTPSSIKKIERNTLSFSIYPNPTSDELNIKFAMKTSDKVEIIVFDNKGQRVLYREKNASQGINSEKFDVRNLNPGIYFMSIHTNNSISSSKFIVK